MPQASSLLVQAPVFSLACMALAIGVAALRAIPALPGEWLISGLLYDVATRTG
jgi:hypothetical protein